MRNCLLVSLSAFPHSTYADRPNVVIILADDLGYGDVSSYNLERGRIKTPHFDQLASEGMRFTDGHSSSGCCSPSRYTLLTGDIIGERHCNRNCRTLGKPIIAPERMTIGKLAQKEGYRTACIGKWHLGHNWPIDEDQKKFLTGFEENPVEAERLPPTLPLPIKLRGGMSLRNAFRVGRLNEDSMSTSEPTFPNWPPFCFIENDRTVGIPSELLPADKLVKNQASLQGPAIANWKLENILPELGERAVKFISAQAKAKQPFLLYLPLTSPHTPLAASEAWRGRSGLDSAYADLVLETDDVVGRVLKSLEKEGIVDNTLVVFTSDNGCASYIGVPALEAQGHFPSGPLRDYKASVYEGGHRVPFIVRWPRVVKAGSVCHQTVLQADIMATLAEILNVTLPDDVGEDSFSILPLLKGEDRPIRDNAINTSCNGIPSLREGPWKLIFSADAKQKSPVQLYNLDDDLGEKTNVAMRYPDRVASMSERMEQLITNGRSTPGVHQKNDIRLFDIRRQINRPLRSICLPCFLAGRPYLLSHKSWQNFGSTATTLATNLNDLDWITPNRKAMLSSRYNIQSRGEK